MAELFVDRLIEQIQVKNTPCIVGLDPALERMPQSWLNEQGINCLLYTSPSPRDKRQSRMPSSA